MTDDSPADDVPFGQQARRAWEQARGSERAVWVRTDRGDKCSHCGAQRPTPDATVCQDCQLTVVQVIDA